MNPTFTTGHSESRRQLVISRLVVTPDLLGSYLVLCHSKIQSHGCYSPCPSGYGAGPLHYNHA